MDKRVAIKESESWLSVADITIRSGTTGSIAHSTQNFKDQSAGIPMFNSHLEVLNSENWK